MTSNEARRCEKNQYYLGYKDLGCVYLHSVYVYMCVYMSQDYCTYQSCTIFVFMVYICIHTWPHMCNKYMNTKTDTDY